MKKIVVAVGLPLLAATAHAELMAVRVERPDWYKVVSQNSAWGLGGARLVPSRRGRRRRLH
jgi:hypothetical protein